MTSAAVLVHRSRCRRAEIIGPAKICNGTWYIQIKGGSEDFFEAEELEE